MATPAEIGAARDIVLDFIQSLKNQNCSTTFSIKYLNQLYASGKLPEHLQRSVELAWQKPRDFILTARTYEKWQKNKKERGHSDPLTRKEDTRIKPWYGLAWLLKQRNPKRSATDIHKQLSQKYSGVSIYQLRGFYRFMNAEMVKA